MKQYDHIFYTKIGPHALMSIDEKLGKIDVVMKLRYPFVVKIK